MKATKFDITSQDIENILVEGKLDFIANQEEIITTSGKSISTHKAIVASDDSRILGIVGSDYNPMQNNTFLSYTKAVCDDYGAEIKHVYHINDSKKLIIEARHPQAFNVRDNDGGLYKVIKAHNAFDGSSSLKFSFGVYRQVCSNGLVAFKKDYEFKVKHTKNLLPNTDLKLKIIATSESFFKKFETYAKLLNDKMLNTSMVDNFLVSVFGEPDNRRKNTQDNADMVESLLDSGKGAGSGTGWDLYNAYTEWIDHYRTEDSETALANSILGADGLKDMAFSKILNL